MKDFKDILKKQAAEKPGVLMVVFPHPDDESAGAGGLLLAAHAAGWKTVVVILTAGGAGQIHIKVNGFSLKEVRRRELKQAAKVLGVDELEMGDFDDGKLSDQIPGWSKWLNEVWAKYKPGLVVTFDPAGFYGHPDHIVLCREILGKYKAQNSKLKSEMWKLFFVAVGEEYKRVWKIPGMEKVVGNMAPATHRLDLGWSWITKWRAIDKHKSQALGKHCPVPLPVFLARYPFEWYHEVTPQSKYKFEFIDYKI